MRIHQSELERAVQRLRAIEVLKASEGWKTILFPLLTEQVEEANAELIRIPRWNFYRIVKTLLRRDAALQLIDTIDRLEREGKHAEDALAARDPRAAQGLKRPAFISSN